MSQSLSSPVLYNELDHLNILAWQKRDAKPDESRALAAEVRARAEALRYERGVAQSLTVSSFLHFRAGRFGEALKEALTALELLNSLSEAEWLPRLYNILGITHDSVGNRPLAMDYLLRQLELSKQLGDTVQEATALHDLGCIAENTAKGRLYFEQALVMFRSAGDRWGEALALLNLADSYLTAKDYGRAFSYAKAVEAIGDHEGKAVEQAYTAQMRADIYAAQGKTGEALAYYQQSLGYIEGSSNEMTLKPSVLLGIGRCYTQTDNLKEALSSFLEALHVSEAMDYRTMVYKCHEALAGCYKSTEDFEKSLFHFETFHTLKETIFNEESEQKTRALEVLHQTESAKQEARAQQRKNLELSKYIGELEALHQQVKELSIRDPLTGLYNRRYLFEHLNVLTKQAQHVSIAILDVDHFKTINDTFSHQIGDDVLKGVAALLTAMLRTGDIAARYGGEEFVIVFPESSSEQAFVACERLRSMIEQHVWNEALPRLRVTVSVGIATGKTVEYEPLLNLADERLYQAKANGRNCVAA